MVYFDAIRAKVRDEGLVKNKAVYLGIGVTCAGRKEVLGLWIEQTEGARFWFAVMNELKARGLMDVPVAVVDGLKGFQEAIESVYPQAAVQTCIVHLIRHSPTHASWKERKALAAALKAVYQAPTEAAAASALDAFEAGPWGQKYPGIGRGWRSVWEQVVPFFAGADPQGDLHDERDRELEQRGAAGGCATAATSRTTGRRRSRSTWRCAGWSGSGGRRRRSGTPRERVLRSTSASASRWWRRGRRRRFRPRRGGGRRRRQARGGFPDTERWIESPDPQRVTVSEVG